MVKNLSGLMAEYLANINIDLSIASFNRCNPSWRSIDYIPAYSKFYFIREGEGWLKIGNSEYYPKPGQLFLMPEGMIQSYSIINSNPFLKYWCHFNVKTRDINLFSVMKTKYYVDVGDIEYVEGIFNQIISLYKSESVISGLKLKAKLTELLAYFFESVGEKGLTVNSSSHLEQLDLIINYIDSSLHNFISVQRLAKTLYLHPNTLTRLFKTYMGISPKHYIALKRMEKAKQLLSLSDLSIHEISKTVGFNDQLYFSKYFKKNVGFAPSDFRMISQEKLLPEK